MEEKEKDKRSPKAGVDSSSRTLCDHLTKHELLRGDGAVDRDRSGATKTEDDRIRSRMDEFVSESRTELFRKGASAQHTRHILHKLCRLFLAEPLYQLVHLFLHDCRSF